MGKKKHFYGDLIKKQSQQKYLFQDLFLINTFSIDKWEEIIFAVNGVR